MPSLQRSPGVLSSRADSQRAQPKPFFGLLDPVVVEDASEFTTRGAIARDELAAVWTWLLRDLAPELLGETSAVLTRGQFIPAVPLVLSRAREALAEAETTADRQRQIRVQLGGEERWQRLPLILQALRCWHLLEKAQEFGRAANTLPDDAALAAALKALPLNDAAVAPLLMMATVGQIAAPHRLIVAAAKISGGSSEISLTRAGFEPLVEAILARAQEQLPLLRQTGTFGDVDLLCRALDRFHRLLRALNAYIEFTRNSRWSARIGRLTSLVSEAVEPRLRAVTGDLGRALRRRDGMDRLDGDYILAALNGFYLLAAVRESRETLGLNREFEQAWGAAGQALEMQMERLIAAIRETPDDPILQARYDAALKMAELRFGADYTETMRRARELAERRT